MSLLYTQLRPGLDVNCIEKSIDQLAVGENESGSVSGLAVSGNSIIAVQSTSAIVMTTTMSMMMRTMMNTALIGFGRVNLHSVLMETFMSLQIIVSTCWMPRKAPS